MPQQTKRFGELLTEGLRLIHLKENKSLTIIQDELGYAVGRSGSSCIIHWRKGQNIPKDHIVKTLASEIVRRGANRDWLKGFLESASYEDGGELLRQLFPGGSPDTSHPTASSNISNNELDINNALRLLAAIPTTTIPSKVPIPSISKFDIPSSQLFTGRERELKWLAERIQKTVIDHMPGQGFAITGAGGLGKTQVVSEFVHRYGQYFAGGVFWLNFSDPRAVPAEIAKIGRMGNLALWVEFQEIDIDTQVELVKKAWAEPIPRLLVFDNCESADLFNQWRPRSGGCRIIITSRRSSWSRSLNVNTYHLDCLSSGESLAFFQKFVPHLVVEYETSLNQIAEILGDFPLALFLAGSFLERYGHIIPPPIYIQQLLQTELLKHPSFTDQKNEISPTGHTLGLSRTFSLSYQNLLPTDEVDQLAQRMLQYAACFAPGEPIPIDILYKTLADGVASLSPEKESKILLLEDARHRLLKLGLIESHTPNSVRLHRLIAMFVQTSTTGHQAQDTVELCLLDEAKALNRSFKSAKITPWENHLRYMVQQSQHRQTEHAASLTTQYGIYLKFLKDYKRANEYFDWSLAVYTQIGLPSHAFARVMAHKGAIARIENKFDEAHQYYEQALKLHKQSSPDEDIINQAQTLNDFAFLLQFIGEMATAEKYFRDAKEIKEKALPASHSLAITLNNLGHLLAIKGELNEAKSLIEQGLAIKINASGLKNHSTAISLRNLGELQQTIGDFKEAQKNLETALEIRTQILGDKNYGISLDLRSLGNLFLAKNEFREAQSYLERALTIQKNTRGTDNVETAKTQSDLGNLYFQKRQFREAQICLNQALSIQDKFLPPQHLDKAFTYYHLGVLSKSLRQRQKAQEFLQNAYEIRERVLGVQHPLTQQAQQALASL